MEPVSFIRMLMALLFVLALMGGAIWVARHFGLVAGAKGGRGSGRRLGIVEVLGLDARRKLLIVRRDDVEHMILLGASSETIIETGFHGPPPTDTASIDKPTTADRK